VSQGSFSSASEHQDQWGGGQGSNQGLTPAQPSRAALHSKVEAVPLPVFTAKIKGSLSALASSV